MGNQLVLAFTVLALFYNTKLTLEISSKKLTECERCKILSKSFNHWLQKTSRGKYEGGDTAWEEAKLKSYSRSEIRLIEIQEGLCSELKTNQDQCYALAEEAEQPLERWWAEEDPNSDLYTWLCIETLMNCCPAAHYGENCDQCPMKDNNVCGGRGKCDGDGSRRGKGTCFCHKGFSGEFCGECGINFFKSDTDSCEPCHQSCNGCVGPSSKDCKDCNEGWISNKNECEDIDECSNPNTCNDNQYCINNEGYHLCKQCDISCRSCTGPGTSNCTLCNTDNLLLSGHCIDSKLKENLVLEALRRVFLYLGLSIITIIIFRFSKKVASIVIPLNACFIYVSEQAARINTVEVIHKLYL